MVRNLECVHFTFPNLTHHLFIPQIIHRPQCAEIYLALDCSVHSLTMFYHLSSARQSQGSNYRGREGQEGERASGETQDLSESYENYPNQGELFIHYLDIRRIDYRLIKYGGGNGKSQSLFNLINFFDAKLVYK